MNAENFKGKVVTDQYGKLAIKNMARIDSLYANVNRYAKEIKENNRNIGVILQECSTKQDTAHVAKDGVKAKEAPKDTTTHTIHVRKMK